MRGVAGHGQQHFSEKWVAVTGDVIGDSQVFPSEKDGHHRKKAEHEFGFFQSGHELQRFVRRIKGCAAPGGADQFTYPRGILRRDPFEVAGKLVQVR